MKYRVLILVLIGLLLISVTVVQGGNNKITICHIPPGNPNNAHTISVSENAQDAHLAHGDTLGPCPTAASVDATTTETETTTVEVVADYTEVVGLVQNFSIETGVFEFDGDIFVISEWPDFELTDGLLVYVRGFQLDDGRILVFDMSQDATLLDADFDVTTDVVPPILLDVSGMITYYDQQLGTLTLDNTIIVLLVSEPDFQLQAGIFITISGELLPDGRILADIVIPFETNLDVDFETTDQKVTICHIPPGNSANAHNISVSTSAIPAHLGHGDVLSICAGTDPNVVSTCGSDSCDAVVVTLVDTFGVTFEEVEFLRVQGYRVGEIARVYLLAAQAGVTPQEIIDKRNSGMGWGNIMHDYPDVHPSELAPGILIGNGRGNSIRIEENGLPGRGNGHGERGNGNGNRGNNGNGNGE